MDVTRASAFVGMKLFWQPALLLLQAVPWATKSLGSLGHLRADSQVKVYVSQTFPGGEAQLFLDMEIKNKIVVKQFFFFFQCDIWIYLFLLWF